MIKVRHQDEQLLRDYYAGRLQPLASLIGPPSQMGHVCASLEAGIVLHGQTVAREPRTSGGQETIASQYERVRANLRRCSLPQQAILAAAFGPTLRPGLESYGSYPGAVLACSELRAAMGASTRSPPDWLVRRADVARTGDEAAQREALRQIGQLRNVAEQRLTDALRAFGARYEYQPEPADETVGLRELARALGIDHKTVAARCIEKGLQVTTQARQKAKVSVARLTTLWPEAAKALLLPS